MGIELNRLQPNDVDISILTGYSSIPIFNQSLSATLQYEIAALATGGSLFHSEDTPPGYLTTKNATQRTQTHYSSRRGFDPKVAAHDFAHRDTVSIGEIASRWTLREPATEYRGKLMLVTGSDDGFACPRSMLSCEELLLRTKEARLPNAEVVELHVPEGVGHALNLHYGANETWARIEQFITRWL